MKKAISFYVYIMLESISYIRDFTKDVDWEEFKDDTLVQDACLRGVTIIGEATKSVPDDVRSRYPDVPWKEIAGTRDKLVHDYNEVDLVLVWQIISRDLLPFEDHLKSILADLEEDEGYSG